MTASTGWWEECIYWQVLYLDKLTQISAQSVLHQRASYRSHNAAAAGGGWLTEERPNLPCLQRHSVYPGELCFTFPSHSCWSLPSPSSHGCWVAPALSLLGSGCRNLARTPAWKFTVQVLNVVPASNTGLLQSQIIHISSSRNRYLGDTEEILHSKFLCNEIIRSYRATAHKYIHKMPGSIIWHNLFIFSFKTQQLTHHFF